MKKLLTNEQREFLQRVLFMNPPQTLGGYEIPKILNRILNNGYYVDIQQDRTERIKIETIIRWYKIQKR